MKNIPILVATILGSVVLLVAVVVMFSRPSQTALTVADPAEVAGDARLASGSAQAAVTLVEFSDFECPACRAVAPLVSQLKTTYPDDLRVVYRQFPLTQLHPYALLAAQAAEASATQGKFWEMHDLLFLNQTTWADLGSEAEAKEAFAGYAQQLGIDKAVFLETIDSEPIKQAVAKDIAAGYALNIQGTPTFFVNGQQTAPDQLETVIKTYLNKQ